MPEYSPLNPYGWPKTKDELKEWYEAGEKWMAGHNKKPLSEMGHRLWEVASKRQTIGYLVLAKEFGLSHHGKYGVGFWAGLVSDYCDQILDHEYLSAVLVTEGSKTDDHPQGLPANGYYSENAVTEEQKLHEALEGQASVWAYCSTHKNPF